MLLLALSEQTCQPVKVCVSVAACFFLLQALPSLFIHMHMKEIAASVKKIYLKFLRALYTFSSFKVELSRDEMQVLQDDNHLSPITIWNENAC